MTVGSIIGFGNNNVSKKQESVIIKHTENNKHHHKPAADPYMQYPVRALAYTNEFGVALMPVIGKSALALWLPALAYFGFDVHDKYKKGTEDNPDCVKTGVRRGILHAVTSVFAPSYSIIFGQNIILDKLGGEKFIKNTHAKLAEKFNAGKKGLFVKAFGNTEAAKEPKPLNKIFNAMHKIPLLGPLILEDERHDHHALIEKGISSKGAKALYKTVKTIAGFATLAVAAIPIDRAYEPVEEKVVNRALGLSHHEHLFKPADGDTVSLSTPRTPEMMLALRNNIQMANTNMGPKENA